MSPGVKRWHAAGRLLAVNPQWFAVPKARQLQDRPASARPGATNITHKEEPHFQIIHSEKIRAFCLSGTQAKGISEEPLMDKRNSGVLFN